jgi:hypothetical protein
MNKYIKIICSIALLLCSVNALSNLEDHSYSLVINQGNCISQAVLYETDSNGKVQIISTAKVSSIHDAKHLGYSSNLKFTLGSISLVDLCLKNLAEYFYTTQQTDLPININSVIVGIAGYTTFKDHIVEGNITLENRFINHVVESLKKYKFNYLEKPIKLINDSYLVDISSIQLHQQNIINSKADEKPYDNIWTYFHTSLAIATNSSINTPKTEAKDKYQVNSGYFQLGIDTASLFSNIKDYADRGDTKVQTILSGHPRAREIFKEKHCTISYWLQEYRLYKYFSYPSTRRNNARGLFLVDYVLSRYLSSNSKGTTDDSIQELMLSIINLINKSIDGLIKLFEYDKIGQNDCVFIVGDFLNSEFIFDTYKMVLEKKITDESMKKRINLVPYELFLLGLTLAAEHIKSSELNEAK